MINPEAPDADAELEQRINESWARLCLAPTHAERYAEWIVYSGLVQRRSPQQVERLEKERGLR